MIINLACHTQIVTWTWYPALFKGKKLGATKNVSCALILVGWPTFQVQGAMSWLLPWHNCVCLCVKVLWVLDVREGPEVTDAEPPSEEVVGNCWQAWLCWVKVWWCFTVTYLEEKNTSRVLQQLKLVNITELMYQGKYFSYYSVRSGYIQYKWGGKSMEWFVSELTKRISVSDRCSPADSLLGLAVSRLAEAPTEDLRACLVSGSLTVSTAWSWTAAGTGFKCAAMSVSEPETESDTDSETKSFARSGAQDTLPLLRPWFLLSMGQPELATPAPSLASVSAWALLRFCLVSGEDWAVSCVPAQRGLCSVSWPTLPPGPISGNTPWGMPPPTGVSREKQKRLFLKNRPKILLITQHSESKDK